MMNLSVVLHTRLGSLLSTPYLTLRHLASPVFYTHTICTQVEKWDADRSEDKFAGLQLDEPAAKEHH